MSAEIVAPQKTRLFPGAAVLFALLFAFHLCGSWALPLIDRDEPRFAEASREMMERGDYVVPRFNNEYRFDKPPLIYWMQVACYRAFGQNEFAARLPSAFCAAATALVILAFGARWCSPRAGLLGALLFSTCLQTVVHAKAAVADMPMVFCFAAAMWAGWEIVRSTRGKTALPWVAWSLAMGIGFLAKGPLAWLPLVPLVIGAIQARRFTPGFAIALTLAFAGAIGLVLLWALPALAATKGEYFEIGIGKHVVHRSIDAFEGHGIGGPGGYFLMLPFYFLTMFLSFFPASLFLPWLIKRVRQPGASDPLSTYLLASVVTVFVVFTLVSTKLPHYTLPAFPLLALLLAHQWERAGRPWLTLRKTWIAGTALWLVVSLVGCPLVAQFFPSPRLAKAARPYLEPEMEFGSVSYEEPSLVWYFRKEVRGFYRKLGLSKAGAFLAKEGPRFLVVPTKDLEKVMETAPEGLVRIDVNGFNVVKGKRAELTLLIKRSR